MNKIDLKEKLSKITDHWSPKIIAEFNNFHIKLAKIEKDFIWHKHDETDELFMVLNGNMKILFKDGEVDLAEGEIYIVPKDIEHKPIAEEECSILLIELEGTLNTGDKRTEFTKYNLDWI